MPELKDKPRIICYERYYPSFICYSLFCPHTEACKNARENLATEQTLNGF